MRLNCVIALTDADREPVGLHGEEAMPDTSYVCVGYDLGREPRHVSESRAHMYSMHVVTMMPGGALRPDHRQRRSAASHGHLVGACQPRIGRRVRVRDDARFGDTVVHVGVGWWCCRRTGRGSVCVRDRVSKFVLYQHDVGFPIGDGSNFRYVVLQMHYGMCLVVATYSMLVCVRQSNTVDDKVRFVGRAHVDDQPHA
jgi:hypothetical protein